MNYLHAVRQYIKCTVLRHSPLVIVYRDLETRVRWVVNVEMTPIDRSHMTFLSMFNSNYGSILHHL